MKTPMKTGQHQVPTMPGIEKNSEIIAGIVDFFSSESKAPPGGGLLGTPLPHPPPFGGAGSVPSSKGVNFLPTAVSDMC
jgi:hypothetical protein